LFAGVYYCALVTRFTEPLSLCQEVRPGSLIFGKWTWNRGVTSAGYGSYPVAYYLPTMGVVILALRPRTIQVAGKRPTGLPAEVPQAASEEVCLGRLTRV
jgi:hypothetical protein